MLQILVVDDEPGIRAALSYPLSDLGHQVREAVDGAEALRLIGMQVFDLVFCDIRLPKVDGLALFERLSRDAPDTAVVLMTAYARVADAVSAVRRGAYDYLTKPFDVERVGRELVQRVVEEREVSRARAAARAELAASGERALIGRAPAMARLYDRLESLAASDAAVLITGESGTGKELVARSLHERSARRNGPFIAVNCAALPEPLLEAELFGHERGAFTGAVRRRDGRFKAGHGGTLLLDEVAEMPPSAQAKLLRVLQEGTIEPVGSNTSIHVDVRVISATHQDLKERMAAGGFREDLYYRLHVLDLRVPPLRERTGDLPLLIEHFLRQFTTAGRAVPEVTPRAWRALREYGWPGNVRELAHIIERAVVLARGSTIDTPHLSSDIVGSGPHSTGEQAAFRPLASAANEFERDYLLRALQLAGGRRGRAAEILGISRKNLWEKLRAHGIIDEDLI